MSDIELISDPAEVTPEWLTRVLTAAGVLDGGRVTGLSMTPVGTGQVGDSIHEGGAASKFPSADETSRAAAATTRTYEVETRFYQQLRDRVDITTPVPYCALLDVDANEFVLIMNDLAPAEQGDQMRGCTVDEAALALDELAGLHAPVWADSTLSRLAWLDRSTPESTEFFTQMLGSVYPTWRERYGDRVDDEVAEAGTTLVENLGAYLAYRPEPLTATHGDYRVDNMLFATEAGGAPLTVVDWQTAALGPPVTDVSYLLGTSLLPEDRAANERDLVARYHEQLLARGVTDFGLERCWEDYRRFAFAGLIMAVLASMLVGQTDRGDEMFMAMANRSGRMAIDLDTLALIGT